MLAELHEASSWAKLDEATRGDDVQKSKMMATTHVYVAILMWSTPLLKPRAADHDWNDPLDMTYTSPRHDLNIY